MVRLHAHTQYPPPGDDPVTLRWESAAPLTNGRAAVVAYGREQRDGWPVELWILQVANRFEFTCTDDGTTQTFPNSRAAFDAAYRRASISI